MAQQVKVLVPGGKASPGPPLGPTLGPLGVNIKQVVDTINNKTKEFDGMTVPVILTVKDDRSFTIDVGTPPASALILKELGLEKGSKEAGKTTVGDLSLEKALAVARRKVDSMPSPSLKAAVSQVVGTCVSMGVTVEGKPPREVQKEIAEGKHDALFAKGGKAG
ncbi:MAG: 50S ribosomal protein L11 [Halobacteria archaeon]